MSASGWVTMVVVLVGVWGGFAFLLFRTVKRDRE
jgi:hypothetical protein